MLLPCCLTEFDLVVYNTLMGIEEKERTKILQRLKRIEGQVRGLQKMINDDRELDEILNQMAASKRAFDEASLVIIAEYMKECLGRELKGCEKAVSDALEVFIKYANHIR